MAKRTILCGFIVLALWCTAPTFAQTPSLLFQTSFGLFDNPLDAATSPLEAGREHTFSTLTQRYFIGDLTNPSALATGQAMSAPFSIGFYQSGKSPSSFVASALVSTNPTGVYDGVDPTSIVFGTLKPVINTQYAWIQQSSTLVYGFKEAWDVAASAQALGRFGTVNGGLSVSGRYLQNSDSLPMATWSVNNVTMTGTTSYDSAGTGVAPAVLTDYTQTIVRSEPDTYFSASLGIPLYFSFGTVGLLLTPTGSFQYSDTSYVNQEAYSAPAQVIPLPGTFNNVATLDSETRRNGSAVGGLFGTLVLPAVVKGHPRNAFQVGLETGLSYAFREPDVRAIVVQDFNYAGGGAALSVTNLGNTADAASTITYAPAFSFHVAPSVLHTLYFDLGSAATLAFGPKIGFAVDTSSQPYRTQEVVVVKTDNTSDGLFNSASDLITTTTTTYLNNNEMTLSIAPQFSLPAAVTYHPANASFGVTVGATANVGYTATIATVPTETSGIFTHEVDGTGALTVPDSTITGMPTLVQQSFTSGWSFSTELRLCVTYYLPHDGTIDIVIKGALPGDRVEVQAIVPLP